MVRGRGGIPAAMLLALAVVGGATAQPHEGLASVEVPRGADVEASWEALFCGDVQRGDGWILHAPTARVEEHARTRAGGAALQAYSERTVRTYDLTDVTLEMVEAAGWIGVSAGDGSLAMSLDEDLTLAALPPRVVGNWHEGSTSAERVPAFAHHVERSSLGWDAPLSGRVGGADLALKAYGPSVSLHARENQTLVRTGAQESAPGLAWTERWLVVRMDAAAGVASFASSCVVAAGRASVTTAGAALAGDGKAHALPPGSRVELLVEGDALGARLASTIAPAPGAPRSGAPGLAWIVMGVVGLATLAGASGFLASRRRSSTRLSAEQCVELAQVAAEEGRFDDALEWTRRGLEQAPSSARLRMDEAWFLWELGRADEAFEAAERAAARGRDGEAAFVAALLYAKAGEDACAVRHLLAALEQDPELVSEVRGEPAFDRLKRDRRVQRSLRIHDAE